MARRLPQLHIMNMDKVSNAASGNFDRNPQGRDDFFPWHCRPFAYLPMGKSRSALLALDQNHLRRTHEIMVNRL